MTSLLLQRIDRTKQYRRGVSRPMIARSLIAVMAVAATLGACSKKPEGQVAAIVNGEEITVSEINGELALQPPPPGLGAAQARQSALKRIIERRLLAQAAKDEGLDKTPDFLSRQRALGDALLVQTLAKKIESTVKVPDAAAIDTLMRERPGTFANRSILSVDQIQFAPPNDATLIKRLEGVHSLDAIAEILRSENIAYARAASDIDSARLPASVAAQIVGLPKGEPFILPQGGVYLAGVVTSIRSTPLASDQARPVAVDILRREQVDKAVDLRLSAARKAAKIEYQRGYAPGPDASSAASAK